MVTGTIPYTLWNDDGPPPPDQHREELACDGLLTWAYNRHGEMCCLDFPGGCELRPRRLLSIATMGRDRCVEACEMLETAWWRRNGWRG